MYNLSQLKKRINLSKLLTTTSISALLAIYTSTAVSATGPKAPSKTRLNPVDGSHKWYVIDDDKTRNYKDVNDKIKLLSEQQAKLDALKVVCESLNSPSIGKNKCEATGQTLKELEQEVARIFADQGLDYLDKVETDQSQINRLAPDYHNIANQRNLDDQISRAIREAVDNLISNDRAQVKSAQKKHDQASADLGSANQDLETQIKALSTTASGAHAVRENLDALQTLYSQAAGIKEQTQEVNTQRKYARELQVAADEAWGKLEKTYGEYKDNAEARVSNLDGQLIETQKLNDAIDQLQQDASIKTVVTENIKSRGKYGSAQVEIDGQSFTTNYGNGSYIVKKDEAGAVLSEVLKEGSTTVTKKYNKDGTFNTIVNEGNGETRIRYLRSDLGSEKYDQDRGVLEYRGTGGDITFKKVGVHTLVEQRQALEERLHGRYKEVKRVNGNLVKIRFDDTSVIQVKSDQGYDEFLGDAAGNFILDKALTEGAPATTTDKNKSGVIKLADYDDSAKHYRNFAKGFEIKVENDEFVKYGLNVKHNGQTVIGTNAAETRRIALNNEYNAQALAAAQVKSDNAFSSFAGASEDYQASADLLAEAIATKNNYLSDIQALEIEQVSGRAALLSEQLDSIATQDDEVLENAFGISQVGTMTVIEIKDQVNKYLDNKVYDLSADSTTNTLKDAAVAASKDLIEKKKALDTTKGKLDAIKKIKGDITRIKNANPAATTSTPELGILINQLGLMVGSSDASGDGATNSLVRASGGVLVTKQTVADVINANTLTGIKQAFSDSPNSAIDSLQVELGFDDATNILIDLGQNLLDKDDILSNSLLSEQVLSAEIDGLAYRKPPVKPSDSASAEERAEYEKQKKLYDIDRSFSERLRYEASLDPSSLEQSDQDALAFLDSDFGGGMQLFDKSDVIADEDITKLKEQYIQLSNAATESEKKNYRDGLMAGLNKLTMKIDTYREHQKKKSDKQEEAYKTAEQKAAVLNIATVASQHDDEEQILENKYNEKKALAKKISELNISDKENQADAALKVKHNAEDVLNQALGRLLAAQSSLQSQGINVTYETGDKISSRKVEDDKVLNPNFKLVTVTDEITGGKTINVYSNLGVKVGTVEDGVYKLGKQTIRVVDGVKTITTDLGGGVTETRTVQINGDVRVVTKHPNQPDSTYEKTGAKVTETGTDSDGNVFKKVTTRTATGTGDDLQVEEVTKISNLTVSGDNEIITVTKVTTKDSVTETTVEQYEKGGVIVSEIVTQKETDIATQKTIASKSISTKQQASVSYSLKNAIKGLHKCRADTPADCTTQETTLVDALKASGTSAQQLVDANGNVIASLGESDALVLNENRFDAIYNTKIDNDLYTLQTDYSNETDGLKVKAALLIADLEIKAGEKDSALKAAKDQLEYTKEQEQILAGNKEAFEAYRLLITTKLQEIDDDINVSDILKAIEAVDTAQKEYSTANGNLMTALVDQEAAFASAFYQITDVFTNKLLRAQSVIDQAEDAQDKNKQNLQIAERRLEAQVERLRQSLAKRAPGYVATFRGKPLSAATLIANCMGGNKNLSAEEYLDSWKAYCNEVQLRPKDTSVATTTRTYTTATGTVVRVGIPNDPLVDPDDLNNPYYLDMSGIVNDIDALTAINDQVVVLVNDYKRAVEDVEALSAGYNVLLSTYVSGTDNAYDFFVDDLGLDINALTGFTTLSDLVDRARDNYYQQKIDAIQSRGEELFYSSALGALSRTANCWLGETNDNLYTQSVLNLGVPQC